MSYLGNLENDNALRIQRSMEAIDAFEKEKQTELSDFKTKLDKSLVEAKSNPAQHSFPSNCLISKGFSLSIHFLSAIHFVTDEVQIFKCNLLKVFSYETISVAFLLSFSK